MTRITMEGRILGKKRAGDGGALQHDENAKSIALDWVQGLGGSGQECGLCGGRFRAHEPTLTVDRHDGYSLICPLCAAAGPGGAAERVRAWAEHHRRIADDLDALADEAGTLDDWQVDVCPRCGAAMAATHHPLCQAPDGTPSGLSDEAAREAIAITTGRGWDPLYSDDEIPF